MAERPPDNGHDESDGPEEPAVADALFSQPASADEDAARAGKARDVADAATPSGGVPSGAPTGAGDERAAGDSQDVAHTVPVPPPPRLQIVGGDAGLAEPPPNQEFFLPIHAFVRLTEREVAIVDHPAFQRLGDVNQLGQTFLVYRGATHRRHEHALGTLHVVKLMMDALARNAEATPKGDDLGGDWRRDEALRPAEKAFVRLGALLHDIGHLPAGHTFEDELGLFAKHDTVERLEAILARPAWLDTAYPTLGGLVDELYGPVMGATGYDVAPRELLLALIASDYGEVRGDAALSENDQFRPQVCRDLIGNTICGDLLDYLHRDWHHLGKHKQFDTRLIDYMEIRALRQESDSRLVVYLRGGDRVRTDAVSAILGLLESRYDLYEMALYHRTKLAATSMLERAVAELASEFGEDWHGNLPERLLDWSDAEMLAQLRQEALAAADEASGERSERLRAIAAQLVAVRHRRLHKKLYQLFRDQLTAPDADRIEGLYAYSPDRGGDRRDAGRRRLQALRQLEADFALPPLTLAMYCPPPTMGTKVAEVQILLNGAVRSLEEHEQRDRRLTGKHLEAQKERFHNLWHIYFACAEGELRRLKERKLYPLLIQAIDCFVLRREAGPVTLGERALTIAQTIASAPSAPWHGREVVDSIAVANRQAEVSFYPGAGGLPALRFLFTS